MKDMDDDRFVLWLAVSMILALLLAFSKIPEFVFVFWLGVSLGIWIVPQWKKEKKGD